MEDCPLLAVSSLCSPRICLAVVTRDALNMKRYGSRTVHVVHCINDRNWDYIFFLFYFRQHKHFWFRSLTDFFADASFHKNIMSDLNHSFGC